MSIESRPRRPRGRVLGAALVVGALALGGCASAGTHPVTATTGTSASPTAPTNPGTTPSSAKPLLVGLVDMGSQRSYAAGTPYPTVDTTQIAPYATDFGGIVVNETWAQLEPTAGHEDWADLDASLAAVTTYDAAHPSDPVGVRLRIFGGFTAPDWAKALAGGALTDVPRSSGGTGSLGRWWTPSYRAAWSSFEHALAARYDTDPLVHEVAVSSCGTLTAEPFVIALGPRSIPMLEADGWTPAAEQACLAGALGDYSGWHDTAIDFAFNPYRTVTAGKAVDDEAVTDQLVAACASSAARGGPRCLPGNNALQDPTPQDRSSPVYATIDAQWQQDHDLVSYFQTDGPSKGDDCAGIATAITHHADSVELWPSRPGIRGYAALPTAELAQLDRALVSHTPPTC